MLRSTITALGALIATGAEAQEAPQICSKGEDIRNIQVVSPGEVGEMCDVRYTSGGETRVPYHANNSSDFCAMKAADIISELTASGFDCGGAAVTASAEGFVVDVERTTAPQIENAEAPAPAVDEPALEEAAPESAVEETIDAQAEATLDLSDVVAEAPAPTPAENVETAALGVLEEPAPEMRKVAAGGPAALVPAQPAQLTSAPSEPVGRLVGAAPVQQVSQTASALAAAPEAAPAPSQTPVASAAPAPPRAKSARRTEDIVAATLRAQQAAWNEGNLEAFMEGYWRDDAVQLMANGAVTKGWNNAMRRYRDTYGDAAGMGRLTLDKVDVSLVTDDVATVTGRFAVAQASGTSSGAFSMVMRRIDGVWRIVLDHTESDPAPTTAPETP